MLALLPQNLANMFVSVQIFYQKRKNVLMKLFGKFKFLYDFQKNRKINFKSMFNVLLRFFCPCDVMKENNLLYNFIFLCLWMSSIIQLNWFRVIRYISEALQRFIANWLLVLLLLNLYIERMYLCLCECRWHEKLFLRRWPSSDKADRI